MKQAFSQGDSVGSTAQTAVGNGELGSVTREAITARIRLATPDEVRVVRDLLNTEAHSSIIAQFLEKVRDNSSLLSTLLVPDKKDKSKMVYSQEKVTEYLRTSPLKEPTVDCASTDEVAEWINSGLSFVATIPGKDGDERIIAHMCGRELNSAVGNGLYFEIKAGLVDPEFRDEGKPTEERLDLQNRNRYFLLQELTRRLPEDTYVVSISKQTKVGGPLRYTGFQENPAPEVLAPLGSLLWPPWVPRVIRVGDLRAELAKYPSHEHYNAMITVESLKEHQQEEEKVRKAKDLKRDGA